MIPTEVAIIAKIIAEYEDGDDQYIEEYYPLAWKIYEALQNDK